MAPDTPAPPPPSRPRRERLFLLLVPLALGGLWWSIEARTEEATKSSVAPGEETQAHVSAHSEVDGRGAAASRAMSGPAEPRLSHGLEAENDEQRVSLEQRLERARFSLDTYRAGTRYPPVSRSIREHADQAHLAAPERTRPLNSDSSEVQLRLKQDRVFVVGDEVVHFSVGCSDGSTTSQEPRPCQVMGATAHEAEHTLGGAPPLAPVPLAFADDGSHGDALAGDGTSTASFQPSRQGFPLFSGTLRISFQVRSGNAEGNAFFDVLYTPSPPARFTGTIRETVEHGSLHLHLGVTVHKAGRYVIAGRVDDAEGAPFAYLTFNEMLHEGEGDVDLFVFGKLILDEAPSFPLALRDVEGFMLKENTDPDRELMTALRGVAHTTGRYGSEIFSAEEWQSEERSRYISRFTEDVKEAEQELANTKSAP